MAILDSIRTALPENAEELSLTGIDINQESINLTGSSISERAIQQLMVNLEASPSIKNVALGSVSNKKNDAYLDFGLAMSSELKVTEKEN